MSKLYDVTVLVPIRVTVMLPELHTEEQARSEAVFTVTPKLWNIPPSRIGEMRLESVVEVPDERQR